jgi:hypothetical protein
MSRRRLLVLAMFLVVVFSPLSSLHVSGSDIVPLSADLVLAVSMVNVSDRIWFVLSFPATILRVTSVLFEM